MPIEIIRNQSQSVAFSGWSPGSTIEQTMFAGWVMSEKYTPMVRWGKQKGEHGDWHTQSASSKDWSKKVSSNIDWEKRRARSVR